METDDTRTASNGPKLPTTFLTFPRELRQKIMADSELFEDAYEKDIALMNNMTPLKTAMAGKGQQNRINRIGAPHLASVASVLAAVHPLIGADMTYLLEPQLAKMEHYDQKEMFTSKIPSRTRDTSSPPEAYLKKNDRWHCSIWQAGLDNATDKDCMKAMHRILACIEPVEIGCWKCWKYNNWERGDDWDYGCFPENEDDSDLEEDMMDDDEWFQHMSNACDCYPNAST